MVILIPKHEREDFVVNTVNLNFEDLSISANTVAERENYHELYKTVGDLRMAIKEDRNDDAGKLIRKYKAKRLLPFHEGVNPSFKWLSYMLREDFRAACTDISDSIVGLKSDS